MLIVNKTSKKLLVDGISIRPGEFFERADYAIIENEAKTGSVKIYESRRYGFMQESRGNLVSKTGSLGEILIFERRSTN